MPKDSLACRETLRTKAATPTVTDATEDTAGARGFADDQEAKETQVSPDDA